MFELIETLFLFYKQFLNNLKIDFCLEFLYNFII